MNPETTGRHPLTDEKIDDLCAVDTDPARFARATFDAGREHERANPEDDRPWEPLAEGDPLNAGDEVRQDHGGVTLTAVVGRVDNDGDPWTADGVFVGDRRYGTWHVRRPVRELPTKPETVIVTNDGYEAIEATLPGHAWYANEAVLSADGYWHGVWRGADGRGAIGVVAREHITSLTWKKVDQ